mmetsp:Transcript_24579/g.55504  ORF Transcript_24579/g.55504 Transcript_24579/m.55504 type:complete len:374 (-) Transcript_24579:64-1185(-)
MGCGSSSSTLREELRNHGKSEPIQEHYDFKEILGVGSFGVVREGLNKVSGEAVAVKRIARDSKMTSTKIAHELMVMRRVEHQCCIRLIDVFYDDLHIFLIQELAAGGELLVRISRQDHFTERDAGLLFKQVLSGLEYLHRHGICHRDVKPENILLMSGDTASPAYNDVKIADFGFASIKGHSILNTMSTPCGTPEYIAPEIVHISFDRSFQEGLYSTKVDVWSAGAILYTMLCGTSPFLCDNVSKMLLMVKEGSFSFTGHPWDRIGSSAKDLIRRMLTVDADQRPTASESLQDRWIASLPILPQINLNVREPLTEYVASRRAKRLGNVALAATRIRRLSTHKFLAAALEKPQSELRSHENIDEVVATIQHPDE